MPTTQQLQDADIVKINKDGTITLYKNGKPVK